MHLEGNYERFTWSVPWVHWLTVLLRCLKICLLEWVKSFKYTCLRMILHDVGKTHQHPMEESMKTVLYIPILCLKWSRYSNNKIIIVWQKCYAGLPYHIWMKPASLWRCCYQQMDRKQNTLLKNLCSWKLLQIRFEDIILS